MKHNHNISDTSGTDTASEGEHSDNPENQVDDIVPSKLLVCEQFGLGFLSSHPNKRLFKFYTGFRNSKVFSDVLRIILPSLDRKNLKYYDFRKMSEFWGGEQIFDNQDWEEPVSSSAVANSNCKHKLSVEDEFLLVLMRLRLGLFYEDLAVRFSITLSSVQRIIYSWISLMYIRLGSISCFPHRDVILSAMKPDFRKEYPTTMVIIDCTEIRIQTPSSLMRQSQTFSNYKSTNTLKGLIGVDSRGGIMFVSQLYTGNISDKDLCRRSGFFDLLVEKKANGELQDGDAVMADRGFTIAEELKRIGLELNTPPFLGQSTQFSEREVITTRTIARHRIHVERAIGKIRHFHIFDRKIPVNMLGIINQIWLVCCMLSNFQDSIVV